MKRLITICAVAGLVSVCTNLAQANLTVNGGWELFSWINGPGVWDLQGAFTYDIPSPTSLKVTDCAIDGDQFEVYDGGSLIGTTSVPTNFGLSTSNPDYAYATSNWSSGEFLLGPGLHSITLKTIQIAMGHPSGSAYLRADTISVIPAPGAIALGGIGVAFVGWLRRRRKI
jgi:hypothetical protein